MCTAFNGEGPETDQTEMNYCIMHSTELTNVQYLLIGHCQGVELDRRSGQMTAYLCTVLGWESWDYTLQLRGGCSWWGP